MIDFQRFKSLLLNPKLDERQLAQRLEKISYFFTQKRENIGHYISEEDWVSAYTAFYFPTNLKKFDFLMDQLSTSILSDWSKLDFIDYGCGPGTYSFAFLTHFPHFSGSVFGVDKSAHMRKQAELIISDYFPEKKFETFDHLRSVPLINNRILFFGNSINEIGHHETLSIIKKADPQYVVWIEPGTKAFFETAKALREDLLANQYQILYPCLSQATCPMKTDDWCHQVVRTTHSPEVERLGQMAKLDRKIMPMILHVYKKSSMRLSPEITPDQTIICRTIRFLNETKFSFIYQVCVEEQQENQLIHVELMKKAMTKSQIKEFQQADLGIELKLKFEKMVAGNWRCHVLN